MLQRFRTIWVVCVFNVCGLACCWATPNAMHQLRTQLTQFTSMQAAFTQVVKSSDGTILQQSKGRMSIQKPGKFRWETQQPLRQLIVTNGTTVWIVESDLQQVTIRRLAAYETSPVALLTQPTTFLTEHFQVIEPSPGTFQLTARQKGDALQHVTVVMHQQHMQSMQFVNALGQATTIHFSSVELNPHFNSTEFVFHVPPHMDVIDQTQPSSAHQQP